MKYLKYIVACFCVLFLLAGSQAWATNVLQNPENIRPEVAQQLAQCNQTSTNLQSSCIANVYNKNGLGHPNMCVCSSDHELCCDGMCNTNPGTCGNPPT